MLHILTLVCHKDNPVLSTEILKDVGDLIRAEPVFLGDGIAAEFSIEDSLADHQGAKIRQRFDGKAVDIVCQAAVNREKSFLIADMDSTIIQQECLDELAAFTGKKAEVSAITEQAMRGDLDFEAALKRRVAMLEGLPLSVLQETLETRITLTPGAYDLVQTMNARGAMTALVSGGFTFFTHRIAQATGFQDNQGNTLEIKDGRLTGGLEEPILGRAAKREALETICDLQGIDVSATIAVGDGANDLDMLQAAGTGVAFHAKPVVAEAAKVRIDHADLTALLYLQGIPQSEFITA